MAIRKCNKKYGASRVRHSRARGNLVHSCGVAVVDRKCSYSRNNYFYTAGTNLLFFIFSSINMKRSFESGSAKRKKQKAKILQREILRNSLESFLSNSSSSSRLSTDTTSAPGSGTSLCIPVPVPLRISECVSSENNNSANTEVNNLQQEILNPDHMELMVNMEEKPLKFEHITLDLEDIAKWPLDISDKFIDLIMANVPKNFGTIENLKSTYIDKERVYTRTFQESNFYTTKSNGIKEKREWLLFSETSKSVYCFVCKLFSRVSSKMKLGCNDWKNISKILADHERSQEHVRSMCFYNKRRGSTGRIDTELCKQLVSEENYWRNVLKRVVATVKLLGPLGLAFRGSNETVDSENKGNFLTCLEYLSQFDNFLKNHLEKYGNCGKGGTSYLSHTICDEFIHLMARKTKDIILDDIKKAMYFSISVDSTPDISHVDQLVLIIRYLDENGEIKERFLGFLPIEAHNAEHLENVILNTFKDFSLDITKCRGQSYDNAANMSGIYSGLQRRIKNHSPTAFYVPCASHSLNLVGNNAAESCSDALHFFYFCQNLFNFFSGSTRRWNILKNILPNDGITLKKICDTRWSARADAILALRKGYKEIQQALNTICQSEEEKPTARTEAKGLIKYFEKYETALLTILWYKLLTRLNCISKALQDPKINLLNGGNLLNSLKQFVTDIRDNFTEIEDEAKTLTNECLFNDEKSRVKTRKLQTDESSSNEVNLKGSQKFITQTVYVICDRLISELDRRGQIYREILENFKIFFNSDLTEEDRNICINKLKEIYKNDINADYFQDEMRHFLSYAKEENISDPFSMYKHINNGLRSTFPNVETILKIFLTLPVNNASGERSFSVLKRVKNYLRNSMLQDKTSSLSMIFIESEVVNALDYDEIIDLFSKQKARRKFF